MAEPIATKKSRKSPTKKVQQGFIPLVAAPGAKKIADAPAQVLFDALWNSLTEQERTGAAKVLDALTNPGPFLDEGYRDMLRFWRLYRVGRVGMAADPKLSF